MTEHKLFVYQDLAITPVEILHTAAGLYATNCKNAYIEKMQRGEVAKKTQDELNWIWVAHYDGYREGYWVATGDSNFSTDPVKLKEKNT
jgi:hypothetical protein